MLIDRGHPDGRALLVLRDCGVIRVRLGRVPLGYQRLQQEKAVTAKRAAPGYADIRLNDHGRALAAQLKPWNPRYE